MIGGQVGEGQVGGVEVAGQTVAVIASLAVGSRNCCVRESERESVGEAEDACESTEFRPGGGARSGRREGEANTGGASQVGGGVRKGLAVSTRAEGDRSASLAASTTRCVVLLVLPLLPASQEPRPKLMLLRGRTIILVDSSSFLHCVLCDCYMIAM